jgi:hypothetical protein
LLLVQPLRGWVFAYYFTALYGAIHVQSLQDWEIKTYDTKTAKFGIEGFNFFKKAKVSFTKGVNLLYFNKIYCKSTA